MTLVTDRGRRSGWPAGKSILLLLGLFAAALLYGDASSPRRSRCYSAIEGIEGVDARARSLTVPIALAVLATLFLAQSRGTARLGAFFGAGRAPLVRRARGPGCRLAR